MKNLSSQLTHWELTWNSQWAHFEDTQLAHSELTRWAHTVSLLQAFCKFATHTVSSLLPLHRELTGLMSRTAHSNLTALSQCEIANSQKAHRKPTVWVILWVHCEVTECPQNEPIVSCNMSFRWVSYGFKFLTGKETPMKSKIRTFCPDFKTISRSY